MTSILFRVSMAVKKQHDHGNSYKEKHLIEVADCSSEVQSIVIMAGNMIACRQTWMVLSVYILIRRQQELNCNSVSSLCTGKLKAHPYSDTLPPTKPCLLIVPLLTFKLPQVHQLYWDIDCLDIVQATTVIVNS